MTTNFEQSTIISNFTKAFFDQGLNYPDTAVPGTVSGILSGMLIFLSSIQDKEKGMALAVDNVKGDIEFGAIVKFTKGETEQDAGNWNFICSFDPSDFIESDELKVIKFSSGAADNSIRYSAMRQKPFAIGFNSEMILKLAVQQTVLGIKEWLLDNAKEGEDVVLEFPNVFTAKVRVEADGSKSCSLELKEELVQAVKDDAGDQK